MSEETNMPGNMFARALAEVSHGDLADQASEQLAALVAAVGETAKKGTLTLTLEIKPRGHDSGQVEVSGSVKINAPTPDVAPSMFFVHEGQLVRDNPRQMKLPFGEKPKAVAANQ
jgi:predicted secreted protein